ncbi:hypothetical protein PAEPH01_0229 [Pancytospora epiphaga]|nr:hypothetical protein PAEPH01_0229 [Pancytospora epiphaga]
MQVENNVKLFISELRNLSVEEQSKRILQDRKKIAAKELDGNEFSYSGTLKKLFFQLKGTQINELEFVKICATSKNCIKQCGYLGLLFFERTKHSVLMTNTLAKDLQNKEMRTTALVFLCNNYDVAEKSTDILNYLVLPPDSDSSYSRVLVAQARFQHRLFFVLCPSSDNTLMTKIQLILDGNFIESVTENDVNYIKDRILATKNKYLIVKLLQLILSLYTAGKLDFGIKLLEYIKGLVIGPSSTSRKCIDIALSLEACQILYITRNFYERAESFIFRLITSENPNSRFLGFSFTAKHGIFGEIVCERIIKLGTYNKFYLEILKSLVNESNYKRIYGQKDKLIRYVLRDVIDGNRAKKILSDLLIRISVFADFEFLCKILYENPSLYSKIRNNGLIIFEQSKPLFKSILYKDNPDYFQLLYDILPSQTTTPGLMASLISRHLKILLALPSNNRKIELVTFLIDVMCEYGDLEENRKLLLEEFCNVDFTREPSLRDVLLEGILLFNLHFKSKLLYLCDCAFIDYTVEHNKLYLISDRHVLSVEVACDIKASILPIESTSQKRVFSIPKGATKLTVLAHVYDKKILKNIFLNN